MNLNEIFGGLPFSKVAKSTFGVVCPKCGIYTTWGLSGEIQEVTPEEKDEDWASLPPGMMADRGMFIYPEALFLDIFCPNCKTQMYTCDKEIAPALARLNKLGFYTKFSCVGHLDKKVPFSTLDNTETTKVIYQQLEGVESSMSWPYIWFEAMDKYDMKELFVAWYYANKELPAQARYIVRLQFEANARARFNEHVVLRGYSEPIFPTNGTADVFIPELDKEDVSEINEMDLFDFENDFEKEMMISVTSSIFQLVLSKMVEIIKLRRQDTDDHKYDEAGIKEQWAINVLDKLNSFDPANYDDDDEDEDDE